MPARSQTKIRRDINRLRALIEGQADVQPALAAIRMRVESAAQLLDETWRAYQEASVEGSRERTERDDAIVALQAWVQRWRPVVLLAVPGAAANLRALPPGASTGDDLARIAQDLRHFIDTNVGAAAFKEAALGDLDDKIAIARKEIGEATVALPRQADARAALTEGALGANEVLVRGLDIVRAIYGRSAPEYRQFVARASSSEEDAESAESELGETA